MVRRLKADFHTHTSDDPRDNISHSAEMLIDEVASKGFDVLAITCHERLVFDAYLEEYARQRGVLLIPSIEAEIEGKHVLILNPDEEQAKAYTFNQLRRLGRRNAAFVAPHPFYPIGTSLGRKLQEHIDVFDAVEYTNLYLRWLNPNWPAAAVARKHGLPMLGNSDCHTLPYADTTFTWIDAEATVDSVIEAIREGRVEIETRPRPWRFAAHMILFTIQQTLRDWTAKARSREVAA